MNYFKIIFFLISLIAPQISFAILNGFPINPENSPSIFKVRSSSSSTSTCTAILYEPNKLLTAFHCVAMYRTSSLYIENEFCRNNQCGDLSIKNIFVPQKANQAYDEVASLQQINSNSQAELDLLVFLKNKDLAIIELENELNIQPTKIIDDQMMSAMDFPLPSFFTLICGYGYYSPPLTMWSNASFGVKHCEYFPVDIYNENYFAVFPTRKSSIAKGDSGAGILAEIHGDHYLYGLLSGYGSSRGLIGNLLNSLYIMKETGYAIPITKEFLDSISFEQHVPKFFRPSTYIFNPQEA